jgi:hypothetical protein
VDHATHKTAKSLLRFGEMPVEPGELVILAVGIVVALLPMAELIAGEEHGHALGGQQGGDEVALLLPA